MKAHLSLAGKGVLYLLFGLFLIVGELCAQENKENQISMDIKDGSVESVLQELGRITGLNFFYDQALLDRQAPVTFHVRRAKLDDVLQEIGSKTGLAFHRNNRTITVGKTPEEKRPAAQTTFVLAGRVTDESTREPLSGAHVYLPHFRQGESTDREGRFRLPLPAHREVEVTVSYVGYASRRFILTLSVDTLFAIVLRQDNRLPGVDIYGTKNSFGVENSQMSAVEMTVEKIRNLPALFGEVDVLKALQRLPGVQSGNDGQAGIFVRGGNYDQNQITLDGTPLYNTEHLKGFVSAINPDMVDNVAFYKGAFPARYGGQLSSVVDVSFKDGDMYKYHTELTAGLLSAKAHVEGPLWKGRTSFNVGARMSYFNAMVQPILKDIADNKNSVAPYADIEYYDVSAKLTHRFSEQHLLSGLFYLGNDKNNASPTDSRQSYSVGGDDATAMNYENVRKNSTRNSWGNILGNLRWTYRPSANLLLNTSLNFSSYRYKLRYASDLDYRESAPASGGEVVDGVELKKGDTKLTRLYTEDSHSTYHSGIDEYALHLGYLYTGRHHTLRWGGKASAHRFSPTVEVYKDAQEKKLEGSVYRTTTELTDTVLGSRMNLFSAALYAEDDWALNRFLKANVGLRYSLFSVSRKTYHSLEPRLSLRWLFRKEIAIKLSYVRMAQGNHLLSSSNLVMPSDIWVPITDEIPLMRSDQWAVGYSYEGSNGFSLSLEGYYKTMDNLLEYKEGRSYMEATGDWRELVNVGEGRSYGAELMLEKRTGKTTGWLSYTWSKALRTFDRPGQELNGGREFYAGNDRRHNLSIVLMHRFNERWEASLSWIYQSGRRGIISSTAFFGGQPDEYNPYTWLASSFTEGPYWEEDLPIYFKSYLQMYSYGERNDHMLPAIHRLDAGVSCRLWHDSCESLISLSVYNLYNRKNISNVYLGYEDNRLALKGVCLLPFMPSISYTIKF